MQCCPLLGAVLLKQNKSTCTPKNKNKAKPPKTAAGSPVGWKLSSDSCEAASFRESCEALHGVRDADIHNMHQWKWQLRRRRPTTVLFPNYLQRTSILLQGHFWMHKLTHIASSLLYWTISKCLLIESQLTDQISNQIPLHRQLNTSLAHSPNLCQIQAAFTCSFLCPQVYVSMKTSRWSRLQYHLLFPYYYFLLTQ